MNRCCVCVHIGQGGLQLGHACWELFCAEHGIRSDGSIKESVMDKTYETFFQETPDGQYVPRALMVDLEPAILGKLFASILSNLRAVFMGEYRKKVSLKYKSLWTFFKNEVKCENNKNITINSVHAYLINITTFTIRKIRMKNAWIK